MSHDGMPGSSAYSASMQQRIECSQMPVARSILFHLDYKKADNLIM
jgi:hypothetical protein